ncbi:anti-sigma B factor antagonist/stage II sporulation protein AA (anti-sigma F factor antagonist) [Oceanobacillus limi]|uniref:Anti-sigma B factor antagonist/stage II sporulation protein AA (Anti-sigma F factor antagonist) n=1 Tax=Oceanobacillus limi TaxID=930131 RepID=A0A1I0BMM5_9BACI|nr:STAS domain-containing protein [Oceanobacillus limi]SET08255.1 anti-sigma B factor antagonist/stage II sporulation protein AA (anti-sigma F factor antagonist) [Oceanobacillus limi]
MLKYTITKEEYTVKVTLNGDLDIEGTELINDKLIPSLLTAKVVEVSLEQVPFVDSTGMGLLMNLVNTLKDSSITITISHVREDVFEVFELLQLPEIFGKEVFV